MCLVTWSLGYAVSVETGEAKQFLVTIFVKPHAFSSEYTIRV